MSLTIENSSIRSGVALFAAGSLYCGLGKFKGISDCSFKIQAGAFAASAIAKTAMDSFCEKYKEDQGVKLINNVLTAVLIGTASRFCHFKFSILGSPNQAEGVVFSTLAVAAGYFGFNKMLTPSVELPPFHGLNEVTLSPDEFKRLLFRNELPPIPITVEGDVELPVPQDRWLDEMPECPELQTLPDRLTINGNLTLTKCINLTELPSDINVTGYIFLLGCHGLSTLPDNFHVNGEIRLEDCPRLTELPRNLRINSYLVLEKCRNIKELPEDLVVGVGLHINQSEITRIPDNLRELERLELTGCIELTELPENLSVNRGLYIQNCLSLEHLPNGLRVGGNLDVIIDINGTDDFARPYLPQEWRELYLGKVGEDGRRLEPERRVKMIHILPENLFVGGDLDFSQCHSLCALPRGLHVGGKLIVPESSIKELPEDLFVGGDISLRRSYLNRLPSWIGNLGPKANGEERYVNLTRTRISQEDIDWLKSLRLRGVRFIVDDMALPPSGFFPFVADPYQNVNIQDHLDELELYYGDRPTKKDVKKAYKRLAVIHHPDKNNGRDEKFKKINQAYEELMKSDIQEGE